MASTKQTWLTIKNVTWLILATVCFVVLFIGWIMQFKDEPVKELTPLQEAEQVTIRPVQAEMVANNPHLGGFETEVPAIDLSKRSMVSGTHEPEFRGTRFISENNKSWTLQIMKVSEEDIIRAYLDKREDRKKFYYIRTKSAAQPEQFILIYGLFKNVQQAMDAAQATDFSLPTSIKIVPEKISTYKNDVNDLGSEETAKSHELRNVVLRKAAIPKFEPQAVPAKDSLEQLAGTTVTVQRSVKNDEKKSTPVERTPQSHSQVQQNATPTNNNSVNSAHAEQQIIDPF